jgi:prepilin-type N-terminal cleavage/methylation domain-containing protein
MKRRGFALLEMLLVIVVITVMAVLLTARMARAEGLVEFDLKKSLGVAYVYDFDQMKSEGGIKFNPVKLFDGYVSAGLFAYDNTKLESLPFLGVNVSLDIAKAIKVDRGILTNFDIGYFAAWTSAESFVNNSFNPDFNGLLGGVIKIAF